MLDSGLVGPGWISEADYYTGEGKRGAQAVCCAISVMPRWRWLKGQQR